MRTWILGAILAIGCLPGKPVRAQEGGRSEAVQAISFDLEYDFLIVVEGQAGSLRALRFIVDTGATRSVIDRKVAARLQLKQHAGQVINFDRFIPIQWVDLPDLRVGPLRAEGIRVMVGSLAEYSEFAKQVDRIIGLDLLSASKKFVIDYSKKTLSFELVANGIRRPIPSCFVVPIAVQGLPMRLAVDTGLSEILLYRDRLRKLLKVRHEGTPKNVIMRRIEGTKMTLPGVEIGGREEVITVVLIDEPGERTMPGLDGYLGIASLRAKRIEFDFANMLLRWK